MQHGLKPEATEKNIIFQYSFQVRTLALRIFWWQKLLGKTVNYYKEEEFLINHISYSLSDLLNRDAVLFIPIIDSFYNF
jgi:hypothetical protein